MAFEIGYRRTPFLGLFYPSAFHTSRVPLRSASINVSDLALTPYENCTKIPPAPPGEVWPEEEYLHDQTLTDLLKMADPAKSRVILEGTPEVRVGEYVLLRVELSDGYGKRKSTGGDLVRVWMKQAKPEARAAAVVTDNNDGSYTATLMAFWEGRPEVVAAIVSPREVIALQYKRRYVCPSAILNTAIFERQEEPPLHEQTPCDYDPHVPGFAEICNLTDSYYGHPWYCGKPRTKGLDCSDWRKVSYIKLWDMKQDQKLFSAVENKALTMDYKNRIIPTNITIIVRKDKNGAFRYLSSEDCSKISNTVTWSSQLPVGYMYNRKWTNRHCTRIITNSTKTVCLRNTSVVLIGDSTSRQFFENFAAKMKCKKHLTKSYKKTCLNEALNFDVRFNTHLLPFCTRNTDVNEIKPLNAYTPDIINDKRKVIIILHIYTHIVNHHSHVYYERLKKIKEEVKYIMDRRPDVFFVIKGPHTWAFAKTEEIIMWAPDKYIEYYDRVLHAMFSDVRHKVLYLNGKDITIATEQWHVHAEDYIIDELVDNILVHYCPQR